MIHEANIRDATWIMANLRPLDRVEVMASMGEDLTAAGAYAAQLPDTFIAYHKGQPAMIFGAVPTSLTTVSAWAVGTSLVPRVAPKVTRFINGPLAKSLAGKGFIWAEARSVEGHKDAHWWLVSMGALLIAKLPEYGKDGETFYLFRRRLLPYDASNS